MTRYCFCSQGNLRIRSYSHCDRLDESLDILLEHRSSKIEVLAISGKQKTACSPGECDGVRNSFQSRELPVSVDRQDPDL